ncbi:MAG: hypothetical protein WAT93_08200 [Pontixanthobacter sp.]
MELPSISLAELPDLNSATGVFGSLTDLAMAHFDDRIIIIMVYIYETIPPESANLG